jgi:hypothetical protein
MEVSFELHSLVFLSLGKEVWYPQRKRLVTQTDKYMYGGEAVNLTFNPITAKAPPYILFNGYMGFFGGGEVTRLYLHAPIYLHGMQRDNFSLQSQNNLSKNTFTSGN